VTWKKFYLWTRDLHLYFGLLISPFVLVFAISVFFLNHPGLPLGGSETKKQKTMTFQLPLGLEQSQGADRLDKIRQVMRQTGVTGEVNFIRYLPKEHRMIVPAVKPGLETTLDIDFRQSTVLCEQRNTGIWDGMIYLHKSPGPHNHAIRGNWFYTRVWRWLVDAITYLLLFITVSGVYLWAVLKAERKVGLALLAAGIVSFFGVIYALAG